MRPTETTPLLKKIYPKIIEFLKFRWFFVSILLGLITSWLIKGPITPLLLRGKSFDGRSLLYQIVILVIYVFFTSIIFLGALIIVSLLLVKWGKTSLYCRADGILERFTKYFFLNSRFSDVEKGETISNTKEQTHSDNLPGFSYEKKGSFTFNLVDWLKSYWIYVVIYIFFLYVSSTTARIGDDWETSQWYQNGFLSTLAGMIRATTYLNGRVASLFFASFFAYYTSLWRFTAPAVFTSIIYLSARLFGYARNPIPVCVSFMLLLNVSDGMRIQTYVWLIGNVGYIPVIALILLYLNIIYNENTDQRLQFWQHEKLNYMSLALLAFLIGLWVENVTIGFVAANILLAVLSYIKIRRISPYILYGIAGSILSCFVLFSSLVYVGKSQGLTLGLTERIAQNLPGIMQMLVVDNLPIYLLFFIMFIALTMTGKIGSAGKAFQIVGLITTSSMAVIILGRLILQFFFEKWYLPVGNILNFINNTFFDMNKQFAVAFCLAILLYVLIVVFLLPQKEKLLVLYSVGMVSAGFMLAAPYLGARIFVLAIYMVMSIIAYMASLIKIKSIDLRKAALLVLIVATLLKVDKFYYYGEYVRQLEAIRLQLIESYRAREASGLTTKDEWLVLPAYKEDAAFHTANPEVNAFHMAPFKRYYHLPADANVIFDDGFAVKSFSVTQVKGTSYRFEVTPLYRVSEYTYEFFVRENGNIIYKSAVTTDNFDYYEFPSKGTYTISCVLSQIADQKEVYVYEPVVINEK